MLNLKTFSKFTTTCTVRHMEINSLDPVVLVLIQVE